MTTKNTIRFLCLILLIATIIICSFALYACNNDNPPPIPNDKYSYFREYTEMDDNYRNYYEIFVYSFADSNGDGIGDIKGIIEKLDYLNDGKQSTTNDLGVTGIWLTPIFPSRTYHKYDSANYKAIDPAFGSMEDMELLIDKCHQRGIKIIIDLMLNHTASNHPWFVQAKTQINEGNIDGKYAQYYNFKQGGGDGYHNNGLNNNWYYEGRFWDKMPDLNWDNNEVKDEFQDISTFWLNKGIDGFRLDAIRFLYGDGNLSTVTMTKNINTLKWFCDVCKGVKEDVYIVGENFTSLQSELANYYESGMNSLFDFVLGGTLADRNGAYLLRLVNSRNNSNFSGGFVYANFIKNYYNEIKQYNENAIDAPFLTNHDTDRSATQLNGGLEEQKLVASILWTLPGNPFLYYGEEIGTTGAGSDENKRVPMVWDSFDEKNQTDGPPNMSIFNPPDGVKQQLQGSNSLLNHYIRLLRERNENPEIARGIMTPIDLGDKMLMAYKLTYNDKSIIVIHNLSNNDKSIKLSKSNYGYSKMEGYFNHNCTLNGENLTLKSMSSALLK